MDETEKRLFWIEEVCHRMCQHKHRRKLFVHGLDFKTNKEQLKEV